MPDRKNFLTINEAAEFLKVSKTSLRRWTNKDYLKCYRIGHRNERRFLIDDLIAFMPPSAGRAEAAVDEDAPTAAPANLRSQHHLCTYFRNEDDQWALFKPHLLEHLRPNARTVYVYHGAAGWLEQRLKAENLDPQALRAQGILRLIPATAAYLQDDYFDTQRMLDFWAEIISANQRIGAERLLLTGEMGWALTDYPGTEQLISYEAALEEMLVDYPWVTVVCQYDLNAFPATSVFDSLCVHPGVQLAGRITPGLIAQTS